MSLPLPADPGMLPPTFFGQMVAACISGDADSHAVGIDALWRGGSATANHSLAECVPAGFTIELRRQLLQPAESSPGGRATLRLRGYEGWTHAALSPSLPAGIEQESWNSQHAVVTVPRMIVAFTPAKR